jgi:hypothetical protein
MYDNERKKVSFLCKSSHVPSVFLRISMRVELLWIQCSLFSLFFGCNLSGEKREGDNKNRPTESPWRWRLELGGWCNAWVDRAKVCSLKAIFHSCFSTIYIALLTRKKNIKKKNNILLLFPIADGRLFLTPRFHS